MFWLIIKWLYAICIPIGVIALIYLIISPPPELPWHD